MAEDRVIVRDARNMHDYLLEFQRYRIIIADCAWWYAAQRKVRKDGKTPTRGIGACHHYDLMKTDELCAMPVKDICADRCMLFLWCPCPLLPDGLKVMEAWGFHGNGKKDTYVTVAFVWIKLNRAKLFDVDHTLYLGTQELDWAQTGLEMLDKLTFFGPGYYTGSNVELVLLGRKGRPYRHAKGCKSSQVVMEPRREHSEKPDEVQRRIEYMYPHVVPRIELFARRPRAGWDVFGYEADGKER